ncbi:MAG: DUF3718 domain-containing protein [Pseudomonadota bacterium]|jgi:hypothetical protein|uniref:DUF3718 domain-containing protein n=1 Tax=Alteromonas genovensis TaxID=471225 RepID=A0A6N9TAC2_9ALTE|nr:DUF3718 domain-containing protein [Alteromonas genovensis]MDY6885599.1 DUF3718 domain-containing protein [Pseudomonadota bacterium]NDW14244.1 DUF3718 domain-containing protein [Alteromonas genovensis]
MKLSTFAISLLFSVAATQSFAKDVRLQPVDENIETKACLTAANEGYQPALRLVRASGFDSDEFSASVRCNGESLRTFAFMYRNNQVSENAKKVALVAKNNNAASQACLEALTIGKDEALTKYGLKGESVICNRKDIADFVRTYKSQNVEVRTADE